jgi:recombination protein RecT
MSDLARFNSTITNVRTQEYLTQVLGEKKNAFVNNVTALVANNKALQECEPLSIMYAATKATALDLPLDQNLGFAYVIPYKNNKEGKTEAQFQMGYRGLVQLAMRSGQFKTINVRDVREGEIVGEDFLSGELQFKKLPDEEREKAKVVGYVAYFRLINGFEKMSYWTVQELKNHGLRYSQTFASKNEYVKKNSKWATDFDAMAKKTVLKLLLSKYAPLSVDMQSAIKFDQAIIGENDSVRYVDNNSQSNINAEQQQAAAERIKEALNANAVDAEIQAVDEETGELF